MQTTREQVFPGIDYSITCSVGVCFLPENTITYTFDQLYESADTALYRAKERGRNRYEICDHLQSFDKQRTDAPAAIDAAHDIEARYLHGDIVSTSFEIFGRSGTFDEAISKILAIAGIRFGLDRITIIRVDVEEMSASRSYQWRSKRAPEALVEPLSFKKQDFLKLFNSLDEYDTAVLSYDHLNDYSPNAQAHICQGDTKTALYSAAYSNGRFIGAVAYTTCGTKRAWSDHDRSHLSELTKVIAAHWSRNIAMNSLQESDYEHPERDILTDLPSFDRFHEEVERFIVSGRATHHVMIYNDFRSLELTNSEYGFSIGDVLLKAFGERLSVFSASRKNSTLTRIMGDRFVIFTYYDDLEKMIGEIQEFNEAFVQEWSLRLPKANLALRTGVYVIEDDCTGASAALDAANFARKQIPDSDNTAVMLYDSKVAEKHRIEKSLNERLDEALTQGRIQVYLQPCISLADRLVVGAEALVRWVEEDGRIFLPEDFLPLYERNGMMIDLDLCVFEQVAAFLSRSDALGGDTFFVSVNASILHAESIISARRYHRILEDHGVDPERVRLELSGPEVVRAIANTRSLCNRLQDKSIQTVLDDFGPEHSVSMALFDAPVSTIKLSREFVKLCDCGKRGIVLLESTIDLMKNLGFKVTCEGIETEAQAKALQDAGCNEAQGFLFSKPLPIDEFERFLAERA